MSCINRSDPRSRRQWDFNKPTPLSVPGILRAGLLELQSEQTAQVLGPWRQEWGITQHLLGCQDRAFRGAGHLGVVEDTAWLPEQHHVTLHSVTAPGFNSTLNSYIFNPGAVYSFLHFFNLKNDSKALPESCLMATGLTLQGVLQERRQFHCKTPSKTSTHIWPKR